MEGENPADRGPLEPETGSPEPYDPKNFDERRVSPITLVRIHCRGPETLFAYYYRGQIPGISAPAAILRQIYN